MRAYLAILSTALLLFSCGSDQTKKDPLLSELTTQKDSLTKEYDKIKTKLDSIQKEIVKLDSTKNLNRVAAVSAHRETFKHFIEVYGNVEAKENIQVYTETSGEILSILVDEGDQVKKGQLLLKIDAEVIQKNIKEIQSQLSLAEEIFKRQKRLWDRNIGSEVSYLEAKNRKENLESRLSTLNSQLDMANLKSPINGTIDKIFPKEGEMASPGMPLMRIINLGDMYIEADISERYIGTIDKGTQVIAQFDALNLEIDTTIARTGQYINPNNRTFMVRVNIENPNNQLKPNLLARLMIKDFQQDSAVVIESNLVQQTSEGKNYVYTLKPLKDNTYEVKRKYIKSGLSYDGKTHIKKGLKGDELVISKGARSVKENQVVTLQQ
jgi:RND family efflux transporter MFP subunit